jgi:hypothetical protein
MHGKTLFAVHFLNIFAHTEMGGNKKPGTAFGTRVRKAHNTFLKK